MIITDITCKVMNISNFSNWIFIIIKTNTDYYGIGEATLDGNALEVTKFIENIKHLYIGKDPFDENLRMVSAFRNLIEASAFSGIDIALWDIIGKYKNVPIYKLLGEVHNLELKTYATFNRALKKRDIEDFEKTSIEVINRGFSGIKIAPFDGYTWQDKSLQKNHFIERGIERIKSVRSAIGYNCELRIDNHWRFDVKTAIEVGCLIKHLEPYWFEAPVSENEGKKVREVLEGTQLQIAGAEMQFTLQSLQTLFDNDSLDIYMFDIKYIGGITGILEANRIAEKRGKKFSPHNMTGPVATAASMHVSAVCKNFDSLEYHVEENDFVHTVSDLSYKLENSKVKLSDKIGLGIDLNFNVIDKHPYKETVSFRENLLGG